MASSSRFRKVEQKVFPLIKALWQNRKAEIAIATSIIALVKPYIH